MCAGEPGNETSQGRPVNGLPAVACEKYVMGHYPLGGGALKARATRAE